MALDVVLEVATIAVLDSVGSQFYELWISKFFMTQIIAECMYFHMVH